MMKMVGKNFCTNDSSRPKAFNGKGFAFHMRRPQSSSSSSSTWASFSLKTFSLSVAASLLVLRLLEATVEAVGVGVADDIPVELARGGGAGGIGTEVFRLFLFLWSVLLEAAGARGADDLRLFIAATVAVVGPVVDAAVIFLIMSLLATSEADIIENPLELADLAAAAVWMASKVVIVAAVVCGGNALWVWSPMWKDGDAGWNNHCSSAGGCSHRGCCSEAEVTCGFIPKRAATLALALRSPLWGGSDTPWDCGEVREVTGLASSLRPLKPFLVDWCCWWRWLERFSSVFQTGWGGSNEASNGAVLAETETGSGTLTSLASVDHFVFLGEVVTDPFAVVEVFAEAAEFFLVLFEDFLRHEFLSKLCLWKWTPSIPLDDDFSFSFPLPSIFWFWGVGKADLFTSLPPFMWWLIKTGGALVFEPETSLLWGCLLLLLWLSGWLIRCLFSWLWTHPMIKQFQTARALGKKV